MKWNIPAKTFLLGEYAAIAEHSAILLSTAPCFQLSLTPEHQCAIHPDSPAGIFWQSKNHYDKSLSWHDPYNGRGGLGASSAQFLGSYLASCTIHNETPDLNTMLEFYYQSSWSGIGLRPSGYDVIAQSQQGCVYINKKLKTIQTYNWPFYDLSLLLIHTDMKLATHQHLMTTILPSSLEELSALVDQTKIAFEQKDSKQLIKNINEYHVHLEQLNLVAPHSLDLIKKLKKYPEVMAIKGCGAMGADIILILTMSHNYRSLSKKLSSQNYSILATEKKIISINQHPLIKNNW